mgnify:CR=1 FL=1
MLGAEFMWGVSAPLGKVILAGGVTPLMLTDCRMVGAAALFWVLSLFTGRERVEGRDLLLMFFASLFGIVLNQGLFLFGLGLTSPVNASIITTSSPIITMVLAAVFLGEPVSRLKVGGVFLGALGALILIAGGGGSGDAEGSPLGDVLVVAAQLSFSCYLVLFKRLTSRYSPVTLMKWMFTYASVCVIPFSYNEWACAGLRDVGSDAWWGVAAFVVGPTFVSYLLLPVGQRFLRPTVTAMYNYVQPIVATLAAVWMGVGGFSVLKGVAVVLVFCGVGMVTRSKSREDMEREGRGDG